MRRNHHSKTWWKVLQILVTLPTYFRWSFFSESEKIKLMGPLPDTSQNTSTFTRDAKMKGDQVQNSKWIYNAGKVQSCSRVNLTSFASSELRGPRIPRFSVYNPRGMTTKATANCGRTDEDSKRRLIQNTMKTLKTPWTNLLGVGDWVIWGLIEKKSMTKSADNTQWALRGRGGGLRQGHRAAREG